MFTHRARRRRTWVWTFAAPLLTVSIAIVLLAGASARASAPQGDPVASSASAGPVLAQIQAADRVLAMRVKALKHCRRSHRKHRSRCRRAAHAVKRARTRLATARQRAAQLGIPVAHAGRSSTSKGHKTTTSGSTSPTTTSSPTSTESTGATSTEPTTITATEPTTTTSTEPTSSTPGSGEPFVKGIDTNLAGWGASAVPQIASEMRTLGVNWEREDLSWAAVQPSKGVFEWSGFDKMVAAAKENGITLLPIVGYAPTWAGPTDAIDYAAFVKAAVQRYGPGTAANLQWWELWNEPYFAYAWSGKTPEPEAYARDALAAAQAAKGVSASVKLLLAADYQDSAQTGGSSQWETSWIDDMFTAAPTLGKWIDGVSVHPYGDDPALALAEVGGWKDIYGNWAFQRIETIRAKLLAHQVNVPFWVTEVGWSTAEVSESVQAQLYADLAPQIAARPWIRAVFPYCMREFSSTPGKESEFGLLKYGSWEPKPAFYRLQEGLKTLS